MVLEFSAGAPLAASDSASGERGLINSRASVGDEWSSERTMSVTI